jgi:hypothetical protein
MIRSDGVGAVLSRAALGDARLSRRLGRVADALERDPSTSLPDALGGGAELEAAYRLLSNERVTAAAILAPHFEETSRLASACQQVLVLHDTSGFEFSGEVPREGLGRMQGRKRGFFGHFALAVAPDSTRRPLGLLGLETVFRGPKRAGKGRASLRTEALESEKGRWGRLIEDAEAQLQGRVSAIHIMDREGDGYLLIDHLVGTHREFILRAAHDRNLAEAVGGARRLRGAALSGDLVLEREVVLSARPKKRTAPPNAVQHPPRSHRPALLAIVAATVTLPVPATVPRSDFLPRQINVVCVTEPDPPDGEPPVEWLLLTTLPIDTAEHLAFIVDSYRARWLIEEFFKALKTGCQYEKRQLESAHSLLNALAVLAPIAHRLLLLRHLAHHAPDAPASDVLSNTQIEILRAVAKRALSAKPTTREALFAVASLGGHIKNNGDPGWLVLGRGFNDLLVLEIGWRAREVEM